MRALQPPPHAATLELRELGSGPVGEAEQRRHDDHVGVVAGRGLGPCVRGLAERGELGGDARVVMG